MKPQLGVFSFCPGMCLEKTEQNDNIARSAWSMSQRRFEYGKLRYCSTTFNLILAFQRL